MLANLPPGKKNSLEFQLYLNLNYTWDSHRQNAVFQLAHSSTRKTHNKNPMKRVIMAKRWPKMAPNIGMLHRNPRQKGLGGQRAIASLLYRPSALPGLFATGFGNIFSFLPDSYHFDQNHEVMTLPKS